MAATVAKAWQRVQQKNLPPPLLPSRTTLTDNGLNKIVATKQQNNHSKYPFIIPHPTS
jgi:hypothetical protein